MLRSLTCDFVNWCSKTVRCSLRSLLVDPVRLTERYSQRTKSLCFQACDGCPVAEFVSPQRGAADAEIKVSSAENTELKRSPFKACSRPAYSHTCYARCQEFFPCLFLPFQFIHLHFPKPLRIFFPALAVANTGSCVGPQSKIGQPA